MTRLAALAICALSSVAWARVGMHDGTTLVASSAGTSSLGPPTRSILPRAYGPTVKHRSQRQPCNRRPRAHAIVLPFAEVRELQPDRCTVTSPFSFNLVQDTDACCTAGSGCPQTPACTVTVKDSRICQLPNAGIQITYGPLTGSQDCGGGWTVLSLRVGATTTPGGGGNNVGIVQLKGPDGRIRQQKIHFNFAEGPVYRVSVIDQTCLGPQRP